jgi:hypothetical protein
MMTYSTMGLMPSARIVSPRDCFSDRDCDCDEALDEGALIWFCEAQQ